MRHRASWGAALALAAVLAACSDKPIEDNLVRPAITAMDQSQALACGTDAETLSTAIQAYALLEQRPPADEAALVAGQYLREQSELWDIIDGRLVPVHPDCGATPSASLPGGSAPMTAPATVVGEIVTETEPLLSADQVFDRFDDEQIARVGGEDCARQLAEIFAASERYVVEQGSNPATLDDLLTAGYLTEPITLWAVDGDQLVAVEGSVCISPS
jgi:hypothetical protein